MSGTPAQLGIFGGADDRRRELRSIAPIGQDPVRITSKAKGVKMSKHKIPGLTLLRKRGEAVVITVGGVSVEVRLTEINPHWGRLKIVAPAEVKIMRKELVSEEEGEPCAS